MTKRQRSRPVPIIDANRCSSCRLCVRVCPNNVLIIKDSIAVIANPQARSYDGHCERICALCAINRPFEILFTPKEMI